MSAARHSFSAQPTRGSALLASMCFASVLALALGSYITLCYRTLALSSRTVQSTRSLELAETGMEEALWALNKNNWSGWSINGTTATKTVNDFAYDSGVSGRITLTVASYDGSAGPRTVTAAGVITQPDGTTQTRTLTSTSAKVPLFVNAVAAVSGRVRFRSGGTVDSYDSTLGEYSAQSPGYSAILSAGSTSMSTAPIQITNAQIKGYAASGGATPSYGTSGRLLGPTSGDTRIDTSRISSSPYQPRFDEVIPSGAGTTLPSGSATIGTAGATATELYYATDVTLNGSQELTVNGPVVIVVSGDLTIANNAKIRIASTGSLRIHVDGDLTIGGNGIENETKLPKKLVIISTNSPSDSYSMATNTPFYGLIYAPVSALTISNNQTIYGALVAKSVTFNASPTIHYDVSLRSTIIDGVETPYAVSEFRETGS